MKSAIFKTFFLSLCIIANIHLAHAQTASLLPNAVQNFVDNNGKPLTSGTVEFDIPNTSTKKTIWKDANKSVAWTNPITLNSAGRPPSDNGIYGDGVYRQIVKDKLNNIIWDQVTSSSGSGSTPSTATGDGDLVGTIKPWAGITAPNQYLLTYGQEVSRTTYAVLFTAITSTQAVFCNSGSPTLNGLSDTTFIPLGAAVEVSCLASGNSTVVSKTSSTITLAANANLSTNASAVILPWGGGNHSTTFNLPDYRGIVPAGNNNMGGVASSNLVTFGYATSPAVSDPNAIGAFGGSQLTTLTVLNFPPYTPTGTVSNGAITSVFTGLSGQTGLSGAGGTQAYAGGAFASSQITGTVASTQATSTVSIAPQGGISAPISRVQPTKTVNYIIKVTPDTNSATASGVTSLGGMIGDIACGANVLCTGNVISVSIGLVPVSSGGTGDTSLTANNVLIGNGTSPVQFAAPSAVQGCLSSTGASSPPSFGSTSASQCGPVSYVNSISGLKALTAGVTPNAYTQAYYAGDGVNGWFKWDAGSSAADNGGTVIQPNSLPATGRWTRRVDGGSIYNLKWFGAKGDCTTNDTTALSNWKDVFIAAHGTGYIPGVDNCYLGNLTIADKVGWSMFGDSIGNGATGGGSRIVSAIADTPAITITGAASGNVGQFTLKNIAAISFGTVVTVPAWNIYNALGFVADNLLGSGGTSMSICCGGDGVLNSFKGFGSKGLHIEGGIVVNTTGGGPLTINTPSVSIQGGSGPALEIAGATFGIVINSLDMGCFNDTTTCPATITIDGGPGGAGFAGTGLSDVTIIGGHSESEYSTSDDLGSTIIIGQTYKAGNVHIVNGSYFGHGNSVHHRRYWLRAYDAENITVTGTQATGLGDTAFDGGMIRIEAGYTGTFLGQNLDKRDITGPLYSDATGHCSGASVNCSFGGTIIDSLALGTALPATSGGTGFASYAVGDLLYASTTTTLAKLADVATTNALISGGIGVAPSWGKIGNSTLTNSSTTVNGITCTLGSTCTVTAAATGVTVGTTTISSGTSHGVLTNNASLLGNTAAGTNGQLFLGVTSSEPNWGTMSGDASINNAGAVTLLSTISAGGPTGSATIAPIITYDAKGRLTTVSSATITPAASSITGGAALTKVDDTNVTLTLGGSPTSALLAAASITAGWTGTLANSRLATMATNTVKGNATSGTASPTDLAVGTCSTAGSALIWTTNTGFGCNTSITANTATTATTATNATNGTTVATSTNASFFPLFAASSSNSNQPFNLDTTFTYNPSSDTLTATNFAGNATTATTATNATNTAITDDTTTNATMYPTWVTATTGNVPQKISSTLMTWNPSTPQLKIGSGSDATGLVGASVYITNNGLSSFAIRDSTNDVESYIIAGSTGGITGTLTSSPFNLRTNNTDRLSISSAGVFTFSTIPATDTATTDNTLCVSTTGVILKGSGALGVCLGTSSERYKQDVVSMGAGLAEIVRLTPKNFFYKKGFGDNGARLQYGFIAEDVVKILPGVTAPDKDGKPNSVDMVAMIPVLVNAIKQLKSDNDNLRMDVLALQAKQRKAK